MERRDFTKLFSTIAASMLPISKGLAGTKPSHNIIKPKALRKGDKIGLIAPASALTNEKIDLAIKNVKELGCTPILGNSVFEKLGFLAGEDHKRLADLHQMFADPTIKAIWCLRGGYGTPRLLPSLNFSLIRKNPKIVLGYSDITALLYSIYAKTGLVTFHGPMAAAELTDFNKECIQNVLFHGLNKIEYKVLNDDTNIGLTKPFILRPGIVRGRLVGGNLTMLASLAGTEWQPLMRNHIVFLEDIDEKPYRIDRLFGQLIQSKAMKDIAGMAMGIFKGCDPGVNDSSLTLEETLNLQLKNIRCPALYGLPFGHLTNQCVLPTGVLAALNTEKLSLTLEESAVIL